MECFVSPSFPHNGLSFLREQTVPGGIQLLISASFRSLVDIQCLCEATIYIRGQHNTSWLAFMSFCMGPLSVRHRFGKKRVLMGQSRPFSHWPRAQSFSLKRRQCENASGSPPAGLWQTGSLVMFAYTLDKRNFANAAAREAKGMFHAEAWVTHWVTARADGHVVALWGGGGGGGSKSASCHCKIQQDFSL